MIAVVGGAGLAVKVRMIPQEESFEQHAMGDVFDYNSINVAAKTAQGDDVEIASSGSAFNIAIHLAKMGKEVAMATVAGNDAVGLAVVEQLKALGINTSYVRKVDGSSAATVQIMNILNDPQMVFGNSKLFEKMTPEMAEGWAPLLESAEAIVLDGGLPEETMKYIVDKYGDKEGVKIFFDPADHEGALKAREIAGKFYCVMPGRVEAEAMLRQTVLSADQLMDAGRVFEEKGVKKTIITIKGGGLYYKDGIDEGIIAPERVLSFASTSG
ncbi:MAG: hypothetical protein IJB54_00930, partial [Firmicutes bacterium]|nr:hypothetical protein [Bacillota bacterium]